MTVLPSGLPGSEVTLSGDSAAPFARRRGDAVPLIHTGATPTIPAAAPLVVPTLSLLLVDDDPGIVQVLGRMLCGLGHLRFALSGHDALRPELLEPHVDELARFAEAVVAGVAECEHRRDSRIAGQQDRNWPKCR